MNEERFSGYRGESLEAIKKAEAGIGDKICITSNGKIYEGILIPRPEYGDDRHVVVKLRSGYNIGIRITSNTKIEKIGAGTKPTFASPSPPKQDSKLPKVTIISTGGTIASRVDYRRGGVRPALTASDLYSVVPELADIARIDTQILFSLFSENITPKHWSEIAKAVAKQVVDEKVEGVVIAHGTDTMGYTSAALSFALQDLPVPVVLVGSQRSADRPSSDAAPNLIGAVTAAAKAPFAGVVVAMHETISDTATAIHRGTKVRKCHTSRRDAFKSVNETPLARIQDQEAVMLTENYAKRDPSRKLLLKPEFSEKVALIKSYPGMNSALIEWFIERGYKGLVLEGTGLGHVDQHCAGAIRKAVEQDVVVAMASQCVWGRINMNVYDSGRDLLSLGVIPLDDMLAETAVVKLMWIFGQTQDVKQAEAMLRTNIAGEFSARSLMETEDQHDGDAGWT